MLATSTIMYNLCFDSLHQDRIFTWSSQDIYFTAGWRHCRRPTSGSGLGWARHISVVAILDQAQKEAMGRAGLDRSNCREERPERPESQCETVHQIGPFDRFNSAHTGIKCYPDRLHPRRDQPVSSGITRHNTSRATHPNGIWCQYSCYQSIFGRGPALLYAQRSARFEML